MPTSSEESPGETSRSSSERLSALVTVGGVSVIVLVVVLANHFGVVGGTGDQPGPQTAPVGATDLRSVSEPASASSPAAPQVRRTGVAELARLAPEEIAGDALENRGKVAVQKVPSGAGSLADEVEGLAADDDDEAEAEEAEEAETEAETVADAAPEPFSFVLTTLNILGSQHSARGGPASGYAPGPLRAQWAAGLVASYGASVVGLQELQRDQLAALTRATGGRFDFWPGAALGGKGVPQSLMWNSSVWSATYTGSITVPFMGGTRPQPIVRLQHTGTGREIYVLNVHNSPKDRFGRENERDKAEAIEIAAINELRKDGLPVFIIGDLNEHDEAFCTFTTRAGMQAANGGSSSGGCRPPRPMRVDWIFGTTDVGFSGFRMDTSPQVRRITDHAVITSTVSVP